MSEGIHHCLCIDVDYWDGDGPSTESVDYGEEVVITIRVWHGYEIDVDVLKTFRRDREFTDWRYDVPLNFGLLARKTFFGPFANILFDVGPYELISYGLPCTLDSGMTKAMHDIEYSATIGQGNEWPCWPVRDVDE